jgi:hypothetical protein
VGKRNEFPSNRNSESGRDSRQILASIFDAGRIFYATLSSSQQRVAYYFHPIVAIDQRKRSNRRVRSIIFVITIASIAKRRGLCIAKSNDRLQCDTVKRYKSSLDCFLLHAEIGKNTIGIVSHFQFGILQALDLRFPIGN